MTLQEKIRAKLDERGETMKDFSEAVGISLSTLYHAIPNGALSARNRAKVEVWLNDGRTEKIAKGK